MEAMNIGSAPSSPASPGINPGFLPNFLMGGDAHPPTPFPTTTPNLNRSFNVRKEVTFSDEEPRNLRRSIYNQSYVDSPLSPFAPCKKAGPPKSSLYESFEEDEATRSVSMVDTSKEPFGESLSRINAEESFNYTKNNETLPLGSSSSWVTVFGFQPSSLTAVLAHLTTCGPVVEKRTPPQGNWMHVRFNNYTEVCRALALNATVVNKTVMIGVIPYRDVENKENSVVFQSPIRARPLRNSFVMPQVNNSVISPQNVPQRSTGLITKAMEYVFGW